MAVFDCDCQPVFTAGCWLGFVVERVTAGLVCEALQIALWQRKMPTGVMLHSDRGSQYCSGAYQNLMTTHQMACSMSGKDNCYGMSVLKASFTA